MFLARRFSHLYETSKNSSVQGVLSGFLRGVSMGQLYQKIARCLQHVKYFTMLLKLTRFCITSDMFSQNRMNGFHEVIRNKASSLMRRAWDSDNSTLKTVVKSPYLLPYSEAFCEENGQVANSLLYHSLHPTSDIYFIVCFILVCVLLILVMKRVRYILLKKLTILFIFSLFD